jgi:signal transduction histidine kinase
VSLKNADGAIQLSIKDDGVGFEAAEATNYCPLEKSIGLLSMKERAKLSGGNFELVSAVGQGTRISVLWPLGIASRAI